VPVTAALRIYKKGPGATSKTDVERRLAARDQAAAAPWQGVTAVRPPLSTPAPGG